MVTNSKFFFIWFIFSLRQQSFDTTFHCIFVKKNSNDDFIILLLYVDDMLIIGKDVSKINTLKK